MTASQHIVAGSLGGVAFALIDDLFVHGPVASLVSLAFGAALLIMGLIRGEKMHPFLRAAASVLVLYWAYGACLAGRTTEPGLTRTTVGMALTLFALYGVWPGVALLRLWPTRYGITLLLALCPVAFMLAAFVAGTEEYLFIRKYRDAGTGPTARWTVPQHWLAYDREQQRLDGSD
jgi:hypothetical protein